MRDNDYETNKERRRRQMQMNDSGWGAGDTPNQRRTSGRSANGSSRTPNRNQNSAARNQGNTSRNGSSGRGYSGQSGYDSGRRQDYDGYGASQGRGASRQGYGSQAGGQHNGQSGYGSRGGQYGGQSGYGSQAGGQYSGQSGYGSRNGSNPHDDYQRKPKNQRKKKHTFGKVLALLQAVLSLVVLGIVFVLDVLPLMYIGLLTGVLVLLWVFAFFSQFTRKSHIPGKVIAVLMCAVLALGSYYLLITKNMLSAITNVSYTVDNMVVVVLKDNPAQSLQEAADYTFGIVNGNEKDKVDHTLEEVNKAAGKTVAVQEYNYLLDQVQALYNGEVGAIVYNESAKGTILETYETFEQDTRALESVEVKTKVQMSDSNKSSNKNVTKDPFLMYISGNDGYGSVSLSGRSDVNMLVAVNPKTRQILMVNTPRDFYVVFPGVTGDQKDKLTHAGNFGMDCLMNTLENVYNYDIDYYVRVNFSSLIQMVDALGGVTVMSDYDFTAIDGNHFNQGENFLNGEQALSFARERKNLPGGDFQRGRDQQLLLQAMINKAMSPAILTSYAGIISSVQNSFVTSMPEGSITDLIKMQLDEGGSWNIVSTAVSGTPQMMYSYSLGREASVVVPDESTVEAAKQMLQQLFDGATLVQPDTAVPEV